MEKKSADKNYDHERDEIQFKLKTLRHVHGLLSVKDRPLDQSETLLKESTEKAISIIYSSLERFYSDISDKDNTCKTVDLTIEKAKFAIETYRAAARYAIKI